MRMKVGVNTADGCVCEFMHCNEDLHYKKLENFSKIWFFFANTQLFVYQTDQNFPHGPVVFQIQSILVNNI